MTRAKLEPVIPRYAGALETPHGPLVPKNGRFISLTNSERTMSACPKRWWFRYGERLDTESGAAARLGTAFHEVMEDIWGWWAAEDRAYEPGFLEHGCIWCDSLIRTAPQWAEQTDCVCERCESEHYGAPTSPLERIRGRWLSTLVEVESPTMTTDEVDEQSSRLRSMVFGYLEKWGCGPPESFKVVGVEMTLAAPIMDGDRPFVTNVPIVDDGTEIRLASLPDIRMGLPAKMVRWPWYQVGRIDGLLQHRTTGSLWILEHKTSRSPQSYFDALSLDPQTTGYIWMLRSMCERGLFGPELQNHPNPVSGFMYDVVSSSAQYKPAVLKNGTLSRAKKNIPSWMYREAVIEGGFSLDEYSDAIQRCVESVDGKLYQREFGTPGGPAIERYKSEILGISDRHAKMRRNLVNGSDQDRQFPRVPVCVRGFCSFKGICINDTPEGRSSYVEGSVQRWKKPRVEKCEDKGTTEREKLPF